MTNTLETKTETIQVLLDEIEKGSAVLSGNGKGSNVSQSKEILCNGTYVVSFDKLKELAENYAHRRFGENVEIRYFPTQ